jgi:hypothetical protein
MKEVNHIGLSPSVRIRWINYYNFLLFQSDEQFAKDLSRLMASSESEYQTALSENYQTMCPIL